MKKTNNIGNIFLVILAVSLSAVALVAIAQYLFGVVEVCTGAVCLIPIVFGWMIWTDHKIKEQNFDKKYMSDESFKQKYSK